MKSNTHAGSKLMDILMELKHLEGKWLRNISELTNAEVLGFKVCIHHMDSFGVNGSTNIEFNLEYNDEKVFMILSGSSTLYVTNFVIDTATVAQTMDFIGKIMLVLSVFDFLGVEIVVADKIKTHIDYEAYKGATK